MAAAKALLADAGYPDGEGFPSLVLKTVSGRGALYDSTAEAYGSMLNEHLGIDVEIQTLDSQAYYAAMNAKPTEIDFGFISYGMDYFDPSNMLGVWTTGGRHPWSNEEYDNLVNEATTFLGDADERIAMFQEAVSGGIEVGGQRRCGGRGHDTCPIVSLSLSRVSAGVCQCG